MGKQPYCRIFYYEKFSTDVPRTCILIGTLNERTFVNDHTGERWYLPIECFKEKRKKAIYPDKYYQGNRSEKDYLDSIREDFNQALAYRYKLYKEKKHSWTLPKKSLKDFYQERGGIYLCS